MSEISLNIQKYDWHEFRSIAELYEAGKYDDGWCVATQYVCIIYASCAYVTKRTRDSSHVKVTMVISAQITVEEVLGVAGDSARSQS